MGWKPGKWKLDFKGSRDKWLVILAAGLIVLILAFPIGGKGRSVGGRTLKGSASGTWGTKTETSQAVSGTGIQGNSGNGGYGDEGSRGQQMADEAGVLWAASGEADSAQAASKGVMTYEQQLEARLKELLSHVEGVGEVEVMIVLKSSEEKVWRIDKNTSYSSTQETDSSGGTRDIRNQQISEETILSGSGEEEGPLLEKELRPEISGVVVSAAGGGSAAVQAEISAAVEALFDVPPHKIKVLKRVE